MFEEDPFSSDDESRKAVSRRITSAPKSRVKRAREDESSRPEAHASSSATLTFHRPGDAEFRSYAGLAGIASSALDGIAVGDLWMSNECHCLRCDILRAQKQLSSGDGTTSSKRSKKIVLLWDLDNYGFRDLQRPEPAPPRGCDPLSSTCLLWGFYGACFTRHFRCRPEDLEVQPETTLGKLRSHHAVLMTPCGGHKEAVDEVLVAAARAAGWLSGNRLTVVVTGDKHLAQFISNTLLSERKGTSAETSSAPLQVIDVNTCDRKIGTLWKTIRDIDTAITATSSGAAVEVKK